MTCQVRKTAALHTLQVNKGVAYACDLTQVDYEVISATCNMFRALTDMYDSFYSVQSMIDYFARDNYNMSTYARPGAWNDPDQVCHVADS